MRSSFTWALALAGAASAKPTQTTSQATHTGHHASSTPANACAVAQAAAESFLSSRPSATAAAIKPSIAYECLKSIPVDKQNDLDLLNYIEPYINFQSTLEPLANPPEGYLVPGVDVIGGLGQIRARVMKDKYKSQIEFALDIKRLVGYDCYEIWLPFKQNLISTSLLKLLMVTSTTTRPFSASSPSAV